MLIQIQEDQLPEILKIRDSHRDMERFKAFGLDWSDEQLKEGIKKGAYGWLIKTSEKPCNENLYQESKRNEGNGNLKRDAQEELGLRSFILGRVLNDNIFEIDLMMTETSALGRGYMKSLFFEALNLLKPKEVWLEVHQDNKKALQLYRRLGFLEKGKRKNYYKDRKSAILMTYNNSL